MAHPKSAMLEERELSAVPWKVVMVGGQERRDIVALPSPVLQPHRRLRGVPARHIMAGSASHWLGPRG